MRSHSIVFYQLLVFYALGALATAVIPITLEPDEPNVAASRDKKNVPASGILVPLDGIGTDMRRAVQPAQRQEVQKQIEKDA